MKTENSRNEDFKELLIGLLKVSGQTLIDNAEDIIGDYKYTGSLDITININLGKFDGLPTISITKEWYPDVESCEDIIIKYQTKKKQGVNNENRKPK